MKPLNFSVFLLQTIKTEKHGNVCKLIFCQSTNQLVFQLQHMFHHLLFKVLSQSEKYDRMEQMHHNF